MASERSLRSEVKPKHNPGLTNLGPLRKALTKQKKAELIELLVELAADDSKLLRELVSRLDVQTPPQDLVAATKKAIADATQVDERQLNYDFSYDYDAYETIERNLKQLMKAGQWTDVMGLSVELMKKGSYQVECSDEGLMTEDIEQCLMPVIQTIRKSDVPQQDIKAWCSLMLKSDGVGFICRKKLESLGT